MCNPVLYSLWKYEEKYLCMESTVWSLEVVMVSVDDEMNFADETNKMNTVILGDLWNI